MPQKSWSAKRDRQYVHIKDSLLDQDKPQPLAEEIVAHVVNNEPCCNFATRPDSAVRRDAPR